MMTYRSIVLNCQTTAEKTAAAIEDKSNEMLRDGYRLVSFSVSEQAGAILVFEDKTC